MDVTGVRTDVDAVAMGLRNLGWLEVAGTGLPRLPDPSELPDCDISALWPGGFIST